jgi:hypothetical protein
MQVADTLGFLLGEWRLDRVINDYRGAVRASFHGVATVTTGWQGGCYLEISEMCTGAYRGPARRVLRYVTFDDMTLRLSFSDGRPFVDLDLRSGIWWATHPCGEDTHELTTVVLSDDVVEERWHVVGPLTHYAATTTLTRRS